jgi:hypothetical protein
MPQKQLCACGCGNRVTSKVELQHLNAIAPAALASQVLDQNRRLIRRKKRSQTIGFHAPFRQQLAVPNAADIDNMDHDVDNDPVDEEDLDIYMDHAGPSTLAKDDDDEVYGQSKLRIAPHEGPSGLTDDDSLFPDPPHEDLSMDIDSPAPSPLPNDDAGMGENFDGEVYGLSNLRRSRRIADGVKKIGQQRWGSNAPVHFVNDREESDEEEEEEEEDIEDDEPISDFDVASDEEDDELFAGPGLEGISLWDSLGEGFLREASQLGICC